jgi:hypothetical protein
MAWFDGTTAQKNPPFVLGDAAHDQAGVQIVDGPASVANVAREQVAGGYAKFDLRAALVAEVHGGWLEDKG